MKETYERIVWDLIDYTDRIEEIIKNLSTENKLLHERLKLVELVLSRLVSKEPIK